MDTLSNQHYDDREHYCLVYYTNSKHQPDGQPFYYVGLYSKTHNDVLKPHLSMDFELALKLHSEQAAQNLLNLLQMNDDADNWLIESHMYYTYNNSVSISEKMNQHETEESLQNRINNLKKNINL